MWLTWGTGVPVGVRRSDGSSGPRRSSPAYLSCSGRRYSGRTGSLFALCGPRPAMFSAVTVNV